MVYTSRLCIYWESVIGIRKHLVRFKGVKHFWLHLCAMKYQIKSRKCCPWNYESGKTITVITKTICIKNLLCISTIFRFVEMTLSLFLFHILMSNFQIQSKYCAAKHNPVCNSFYARANNTNKVLRTTIMGEIE